MSSVNNINSQYHFQEYIGHLLLSFLVVGKIIVCSKIDNVALNEDRFFQSRFFNACCGRVRLISAERAHVLYC